MPPSPVPTLASQTTLSTLKTKVLLIVEIPFSVPGGSVLDICSRKKGELVTAPASEECTRCSRNKAALGLRDLGPIEAPPCPSCVTQSKSSAAQSFCFSTCHHSFSFTSLSFHRIKGLLCGKFWHIVGAPWPCLTCPVQTQRLQKAGPGKLHPQRGDVQGQRGACPGLVSPRLRGAQRPLSTSALPHGARHKAVDEV